MSDERLVVRLEARVTDLEKGMKRADQIGTRTYQSLRRGSRSATQQMAADMNRSTASVNKALATTSAKIGTFAKVFAGGLVGGVVAGAFAGLSSNIAGTMKGIAQLGNEAKRAGVSAQVFQEWKYVAEANRISVDSLVDGFKELSLRADEFITTGVGPAAEAFTRLGYRSDDLKRKLKDPSALMLEIMGRLEGLDKAAQIRVADEIFGGTGGERFVELLGQGQGAIAATIAEAHRAGAVLDDEMIAKADEIDRKFNQITTSANAFFKRVVVGAVLAGASATDFREKLDAIFTNEDERCGVMAWWPAVLRRRGLYRRRVAHRRSGRQRRLPCHDAPARNRDRSHQGPEPSVQRQAAVGSCHGRRRSTDRQSDRFRGPPRGTGRANGGSAGRARHRRAIGEGD